jgi:hypothetical protein
MESSGLAAKNSLASSPAFSGTASAKFTQISSSTSAGLAILVHGTQWDDILRRIYLAGGKVVYRQLGNGKYEATCTVPEGK